MGEGVFLIVPSQTRLNSKLDWHHIGLKNGFMKGTFHAFTATVWANNVHAFEMRYPICPTQILKSCRSTKLLCGLTCIVPVNRKYARPGHLVIQWSILTHYKNKPSQIQSSWLCPFKVLSRWYDMKSPSGTNIAFQNKEHHCHWSQWKDDSVCSIKVRLNHALSSPLVGLRSVGLKGHSSEGSFLRRDIA